MKSIFVKFFLRQNVETKNFLMSCFLLFLKKKDCWKNTIIVSQVATWDLQRGWNFCTTKNMTHCIGKWSPLWVFAFGAQPTHETKGNSWLKFKKIHNVSSNYWKPLKIPFVSLFNLLLSRTQKKKSKEFNWLHFTSKWFKQSLLSAFCIKSTKKNVPAKQDNFQVSKR